MKDQLDIYLLAKYFNKECNDEETQVVDNWLTASSENKKMFDGYKEIWEKSKSIPEMFQPNAEATWINVKSRISADKFSKVNKRFIYQLTKIAAVFLLLIGSGIIIRNYYFNQNIVVATTIDQREIKLPDGTIVTLNRNSNIEYPRKFAKNNRMIAFNGEGFFEVVKDSKRQFIIQTENTTTTVLGTQFNLEAYHENEKVIINVTEGKVMFSLKKDKNMNVILTKGEEGIYDPIHHKIKEQNTENNNFLSWKTKQYKFNESTLIEILELISKDYSIAYKFENKSLENERLTATFSNLTIEEIIETIEIALNIDIEVNSNQIIIR
ncbi:FecR family protein [Bacteroidota bacterium]